MVLASDFLAHSLQQLRKNPFFIPESESSSRKASLTTLLLFQGFQGLPEPSGAFWGRGPVLRPLLLPLPTPGTLPLQLAGDVPPSQDTLFSSGLFVLEASA